MESEIVMTKTIATKSNLIVLLASLVPGLAVLLIAYFG